MLSATASLGLVLLWDVDGGLTPIDKYLYSAEDYIKVSLGQQIAATDVDVLYPIVWSIAGMRHCQLWSSQ